MAESEDDQTLLFLESISEETARRRGLRFTSEYMDKEAFFAQVRKDIFSGSGDEEAQHRYALHALEALRPDDLDLIKRLNPGLYAEIRAVTDKPVDKGGAEIGGLAVVRSVETANGGMIGITDHIKSGEAATAEDERRRNDIVGPESTED